MKKGVVWHTGLANITLSSSEHAIGHCLPAKYPICHLESLCARGFLSPCKCQVYRSDCHPMLELLEQAVSSFGLQMLLVQHRLTLRPLFCFKTSRQTSGAHPTYSVGTGILSRGKRGPWCDADHSLSSSADVKNMRSHTSTPPTFLHVLGRNAFIFTFRPTLK